MAKMAGLAQGCVLLPLSLPCPKEPLTLFHPPGASELAWGQGGRMETGGEGRGGSLLPPASLHTPQLRLISELGAPGGSRGGLPAQ